MLKYGMQKVTVLTAGVHLYKMDKTKVGIRQVISNPLLTGTTLNKVVPSGVRLGGTELRKVPSWIELFNLKTGKTFYAMPYCYFENSMPRKTNYLEVYGRCQGIGLNNTTDNPVYLSAVITQDMHLNCGDEKGLMMSWDYQFDVVLGITPAVITMRNGVRRLLYSDAYGIGKLNTSYPQTILAEDSESIIVGVTGDNITPKNLTNFLENQGCVQVTFGDSGGSAYAYYDEKLEKETGSVEPIPDPTPDFQGIEFKIVKGTMTNGGYPTRGTFDGAADTTKYLALNETFKVDSMRRDRSTVYYVGHICSGPMKGRWIQLDPVNIQ